MTTAVLTPTEVVAIAPDGSSADASPNDFSRDGTGDIVDAILDGADARVMVET